MTEKTVFIKEEYIKLDSAMKLSGFVGTGGYAKLLVQNGEVKVNGEVCLQRGKKLKDGDTAQFSDKKLIIKYAG